MKHIIFAFLLLISTSVLAEDTYVRSTVQVELGESYNRGCRACNNPENQFFTLGYRYYFSEKNLRYLDSGWFTQVRLTTFNDGNRVQQSYGGTWFGGSVGYRTKSNKFPKVFRRFFIDTSLGWGVLNNPDGHPKPNESGKLSQKGQFEITLGGGYRLNQRVNIIFGIGHLSNCNQICNRGGNSSSPNNGRDWRRVGVEIKFKTSQRN